MPAGASTGNVIALAIDPVTGQRQTGQDREIDLLYGSNGTFVRGSDPLTVAVSPGGTELYVVAASVSETMPGGSVAGTYWGSGIFIVNTATFDTIDFIPLSGAMFPPVPGDPHPPVSVATNRPRVVFSHDGRLAFVSGGDRMFIVNTSRRVIVTEMDDLPVAIPAVDPLNARLQLPSRLSALSAALHAQGRTIVDLRIAPDGRTLYALTGRGTDNGKLLGGRVIPIAIDLYGERTASVTVALLNNFFTMLAPIIEMPASGGPSNGADEPEGLAVSPAGQVYVVHGDAKFISITPDTTALGPLVAEAGLTSYLLIDPILGQMVRADILREVQQTYAAMEATGQVLLGAPGPIAGATPTVGPNPPGGQTPLAPPDLVFNSGLILGSQRAATALPGLTFGRRPFAMAVHPNGRRAIAAFFQTGNFGVMSLDTQLVLPRPDLSTSINATLFAGMAGVTPSVELDNFLWPKRGIRPVDQTSGGPCSQTSSCSVLPSPDEALLYPWDIAYAQNGKFAVATHVGSDLPKEYGFIDVDTGELAVRGGAAVSIIDDGAIAADLSSRATTTVPLSAGSISTTSFFSRSPICKQHGPTIDGVSPCVQEAVTRIFDYLTPDGRTARLSRLRGVAIQPFVTLDAPRFGDVVGATATIATSWRQSGIQLVNYAIYEVGASGNAIFQGEIEEPLTLSQSAARSANETFGNVFALATNNAAPVDGNLYRLDVRICKSRPCGVPQSGQSDHSFSMVSTTVRFKQ
jgi:hypothetical protein